MAAMNNRERAVELRLFGYAVQADRIEAALDGAEERGRTEERARVVATTLKWIAHYDKQAGGWRAALSRDGRAAHMATVLRSLAEVIEKGVEE